METPGMNEAITALVTAAIAAIVRYFEKKRMRKDQDTTNHFKK
jgi:hypothetical protein